MKKYFNRAKLGIVMGLSALVLNACGGSFDVDSVKAKMPGKTTLWELYDAERKNRKVNYKTGDWSLFLYTTYELNGVENYTQLRKVCRKQGHVLIPDLNKDGVGGAPEKKLALENSI